MLYECGVRWCQHTAVGVVLSHWYFLPYASPCLFHMISVCILYFQTKQDLISGPGSYCGFFRLCFTWRIVARFTILTFAVGGTLISMVVVGFLINATCHVHGVCSAPCLQDSLFWGAWESTCSNHARKTNPNQSKSCHLSCHHSSMGISGS